MKKTNKQVTSTQMKFRQTDLTKQSEKQTDCAAFEYPPDTQSNLKSDQCHECAQYKAKIRRLEREVHYWQGLYFKKKNKPLSLDILEDDAKVKSYTGLPSKKVFDSLFSSFGGKVKKIQKWHSPSCVRSNLNRNRLHHQQKSNQTVLTAKEEYFISLFQIKTMLKNDIIGDLFGITSTVVSRTCLTWWKFMAKELKAIIYNPQEEAQKALLPPSFNNPKYNKVQHIIDCTEVFVETPKNKIVQSSLWSNYKHHYTCKYLVSITPYGLLNFVSKGYGGHMSDRHIVENSGFLNEIR